MQHLGFLESSSIQILTRPNSALPVSRAVLLVVIAAEIVAQSGVAPKLTNTFFPR